ncbi:hypothetical protein GCM10027402_10410 [Arthrobacter monumenti]
MAQSAQLRIGLADIALLTKVQRPVVSMWRSRSKGSDTPFPEPAGVANGRELFEAGQIVDWLADTGRGNNADAAEDVSAFAFMEHFRPHSPRIFDGVTSLLTLRQLLGSSIGMMTTDELMDAADESDPDDTFLYTELEALGEDLSSLAIYADLLAEGAYSTEAAFENLMNNRFRAGIREQSDVALTDTVIELVAAAAVELSSETAEGRLFADTTEGGSDLLMGIVSAVQEAAPLTLVTRNDDGGASRLVRRRLRVHDLHRQDLRVDDSGQFELEGRWFMSPSTRRPARPKCRRCTIRQRAFSERITELMNKYTNQQLTSAEVIAELVAMAQEVVDEASRGARFSPPLNEDELAFYDAVSQNESAVEVQGEGILAEIARQLVGVMRRDVSTDWTVRDDVQAKLRSSIKRLLVINGYPPDKQPAAIKLVMEQMDSMGPLYAKGLCLASSR